MLSHSHILKLHCPFETLDNVILLLDLAYPGYPINNKNLKKYGEIEIVKFASKFLQCVNYMHSRHIMHRNINYNNLLFEDPQDLSSFKLANFELAVFFDESCVDNDFPFTPYNVLLEGSQKSTFLNSPDINEKSNFKITLLNNREKVTKKKTIPKNKLSFVCGNMDFAAPEMINQLGYDNKIDVYNIVVMIYIMLSGGSAIDLKSEDILVDLKFKMLEEDESDMNNSLSFLATEFIKALTQENPDNRPTASEAMNHEWIRHKNVD